MSLKTLLDSSLGKSIDQICANHFHDLSQNHCAHYVSHMLGLDFSFNCVEFKGGSKPAANVRVHEVFARCPKVGMFGDADMNEEFLVFVTRDSNVNVPDKKMGNIPQKHIGIFCDGHVYHYSNTPDKVVKWTPDKFLSVFQAAYSGNQKLYFGTIPGSDLELTVAASGTGITNGIPFKIEKVGQKWMAAALSGPDQAQFYVGRETKDAAQGFFGLFQRASEYYGEKYNPGDLVNSIDHWAFLLDATAHCESNGFINLINTYDRAKFTFGFYQLAAHTPNDNLILLFRELMKLPSAAQYFPELGMIDGKLHRVDANGGNTNLEAVSDNNLQLFMDFLNPRRKEIDDQEILHAARLIHWTANDEESRHAQFRVSAEILQKKMSDRYNAWYNLNGKSDVICTIIADIHHQGRASKTVVKAALASSNPKSALLRVNHAKYKGRNLALEAKIDEMTGSGGPLGKKVYDAANNEFV